MRKITWSFLLLLVVVIAGMAQFDNPFSATAKLEKGSDGAYRVKVDFEVPSGMELHTAKVSAPGDVLIPEKIAKGEIGKDPVTGEKVEAYKHDFSFVYKVAPAAIFPLKVMVNYQGCREDSCFMPRSETFELSPDSSAATEIAASDSKNAGDILAGFKIAGTDYGYKKADEFIKFLDRVESGKSDAGNPLHEMVARRGVFILIIFVLVSGLALNLTPCVLPMIPINIAIIGAGTQAGSKVRGFMLGAVYGLGIALSYGSLGLVVVLTGSQFGALNSSPWFNLAIAVIFTLLALALFGLFRIDFSKFQSAGGGKSRGPFITAFIFGALAALLAGACIAPVLIWVLLFSTEIYRHGNPAGLLLPFILGFGMALPWPFAGAGLSFLPKPGKWMENINRIFGVIILLAAIYYGWLGVKLLRPAETGGDRHVAGEVVDWHTSLDEALKLSRETGKPVFIDFWATWCKSCELMSATTLKDSEVAERLNNYLPLKYQAENSGDPATKKVLEAFGVKGLPFYVVLKPEEKAKR